MPFYGLPTACSSACYTRFASAAKRERTDAAPPAAHFRQALDTDRTDVVKNQSLDLII
uniref:Uncharacterized protein n=1 Tax=uncultured Armatimonadetes bacterium TaxID=157466 RepID=A0A6J4HGK0_9BACT|nr:hypothetical protein AVDCRST_MAG63-588 [uncultured Armatimonadetes bacterium]